MPLTASSAGVFYLTTPEEVELDRPVSDEQAVEALRTEYEPLPGIVDDVDVTGDDAFGI